MSHHPPAFAFILQGTVDSTHTYAIRIHIEYYINPPICLVHSTCGLGKLTSHGSATKKHNIKKTCASYKHNNRFVNFLVEGYKHNIILNAAAEPPYTFQYFV